MSRRGRIEQIPGAPSARGRALIAIVVVAGLALAAPAPARAGTYRAALCNPDLVAFHADAIFERNSRHYRSATSCQRGGDGLAVEGNAGATMAGAWGAWVIRAPRGITITKLSVKAAGRARGGHAPELLIGRAAEPRLFATPSRRLRRFRWSGRPARTFAARLRCRRSPGCRRGKGSRVRIKRIAAVLDDRARPTLRLGGSLFGRGSRRGIQAVAPTATDVGGGVRRLLLQVNGRPVTAHTLRCRLADGIGLRLEPCPGLGSAAFVAATAAPPFRQGLNRVRVCASDYARNTAANRTCAERRVRVDNLCPTSAIGGGATLRARLLRRGRAAIVAGRLLDQAGQGVWGARVCVATRVRMAGVAERLAVAPLTGSGGRFRARIAAGPSRQVRVAYWPSPVGALERYLHLDVRARPRLRLRPRHPIANHRRVRFEVRLPGPRPARRRVRIQARAGHRWLDVRSGLTGARGIYWARYRFRATTGRRTYAFRAVVGEQRGYPYEAGRSKVKRVTVIG